MDLLDNEDDIDAAWLSSKLGFDVKEATLRKDRVKMGGMSAEIRYLDVVPQEGGSTISMVVKGSQTSVSDLRKATGLAREASFYNECESLGVESVVPKCYAAEGDMESGEMLCFLENLEGAVPAGVFFGAGNPNNWGIRDELPEKCAGFQPKPEKLSEEAFGMYARLHGNTWRSTDLLEKRWLRGAEWYGGKGRDTWEASQRRAAEAWKAEMELLKEGKPSITWDDHLIACLESSFSKASWDSFQNELQGGNTRPFSLVHGDAHPHNALLVKSQQQGRASSSSSSEHERLCLIDFEMVGLGSPAQELGQWTISHFEPETRRACERGLVSKYHSELVSVLEETGKAKEASSFPLEACWEEYVAGGAGRWAWFVPVLIRLCGPAMGQFFHDQLAAFLRDHVQDPSSCPMPRV